MTDERGDFHNCFGLIFSQLQWKPRGEGGRDLLTGKGGTRQLEF